MAGNKSTTKFAIYKPSFYELRFLNEYNEEVKTTGTPKQILNFILNQQL